MTGVTTKYRSYWLIVYVVKPTSSRMLWSTYAKVTLTASNCGRALWSYPAAGPSNSVISAVSESSLSSTTVAATSAETTELSMTSNSALLGWLNSRRQNSAAAAAICDVSTEQSSCSMMVASSAYQSLQNLPFCSHCEILYFFYREITWIIDQTLSFWLAPANCSV